MILPSRSLNILGNKILLRSLIADRSHRQGPCDNHGLIGAIDAVGDTSSHINPHIPKLRLFFFFLTHSGRRAELRHLASVPECYLLSFSVSCHCATERHWIILHGAGPCWPMLTTHLPSRHSGTDFRKSLRCPPIQRSLCPHMISCY